MITLICGVGRAGKTTFSKRFENVVHFDSMGFYPERFEKVNALVSAKNEVVVEGIYNQKTQRVKLLESYKGNERRCIWLNTPRATVVERMKKDRIPISVKHFDFEPPTFEEGWTEILIIEGAKTWSLQQN